MEKIAVWIFFGSVGFIVCCLGLANLTGFFIGINERAGKRQEKLEALRRQLSAFVPAAPIKAAIVAGPSIEATPPAARPSIGQAPSKREVATKASSDAATKRKAQQSWYGEFMSSDTVRKPAVAGGKAWSQSAITVRTSTGERQITGNDLPRAVAEAGAKTGDRIRVDCLGMCPVEIPIDDNGRWETKEKRLYRIEVLESGKRG